MKPIFNPREFKGTTPEMAARALLRPLRDRRKQQKSKDLSQHKIGATGGTRTRNQFRSKKLA